MKDVLLVGLGGFIGSASRYGIHVLASKHFPEKAFFGTLSVNLIGCLVIGLLSGALLKHSNTYSLFLITGFCGGFTTFSTFALDGLKLMKAGLHMQFLMYASISVIGGLLLCLGGLILANRG